MFMYVYLEINSYPKLSVKLMMIMMTEIRRRGGLNSSPEVDRSYKYMYRGNINIYVGITDISIVYDKNIYNQYWA